MVPADGVSTSRSRSVAIADACNAMKIGVAPAAGCEGGVTFPGGRIERKPGGREPAGVFVDNARALVEAKIPPPRAADRDLALYRAQELLVRNGVTAAADMGASIEDWMTYRRAGDEGRLRIRIMVYAGSVPEMVLIGGSGPTAWLYEDRLRLNGLKLYEAGKPNKVLHDIIRHNVRTPDHVFGDLAAQVSSGRLACNRLSALLSRHGYDDIAVLSCKT